MENELIRAVYALPGLVWTSVPDGNVDFLNQRWCEYTGRERTNPVDRDRCSDLSRRLASAVCVVENHTRLRHAAGE
jgi:PAS domain-containing protein